MAEMEKREHELRAFEVDGERLRKILTELGATTVGKYDFKRAVLDVIPANPNKWIRVRTDGTTTTLAVKERISKDFDGTGEEEVETGNFNDTLSVLRALGGYEPRSVQESRRDAYMLNGIEVSIDSWPKLTQEIIEFEAEDEAAVYQVAEQLGVRKQDLTAESVEEYYLRTLGIDVKTTPELLFEA